MIQKLFPLLLAACATDYRATVGPLASDILPMVPNEKRVRFQAEFESEPVAASCSIGGPAMDVRITTPTTVSIPFANGQAMTSIIDCRYNGLRLSTQTPPNAQTSSITADFSNPRSEFWFKRANGGVIYYTRGDVVVRIGPTP